MKNKLTLYPGAFGDTWQYSSEYHTSHKCNWKGRWISVKENITQAEYYSISHSVRHILHPQMEAETGPYQESQNHNCHDKHKTTTGMIKQNHGIYI